MENNRENGETVKEALSPLTELEDAHKLEWSCMNKSY